MKNVLTLYSLDLILLSVSVVEKSESETTFFIVFGLDDLAAPDGTCVPPSVWQGGIVFWTLLLLQFTRTTKLDMAGR